MDLESRWQSAQLAFQGKIRTAAKNAAHVSRDHGVEDMEQEFLVVLWECCSMYKPERGATFSTFFWLRARQRVGQIREHQNVQKRGGGMTIHHVDLDDETIQDEVAFILSSPSAEDEYMAWEDVRGVFIELAREGEDDGRATA